MSSRRLTIENENTLRAACGNAINLFLGAGFSTLASDRNSVAMPAGDALRQELLLHFKVPEYSSLNLAQLCLTLEASNRDALRGFLVDRFYVNTFDAAYGVITKLPIQTIFTTNIDNLAHRVFEDNQDRYLNDIALSGPAFGTKTAVDFVALHGCILHDGPLLFNPMDLASAFSMDPDKWHMLTGRLQQVPTIFCGYSLGDAGVLQALNPRSIAGRPHQDKWILLRDPDEATKTYFSSMGFGLIIGETVDLLNWFSKITSSSDTSAAPKSKNSHPIIRELSIPTPHSVPVRPLKDFYAGSAPEWHDIFSNRLYRTSHYAKIINEINSKKHVVVLGMLASGKSTLMMQVAAGMQFPGHKLVCSSMTIEKAMLLFRALGEDRALIFMDDFADSLQAYNYLLNIPTIQVIGFERDYFYEQISHLVPHKKISHIDCTALTDADIQGLVSAIPAELKKSVLIHPKTEYPVLPSLYEVIEVNMLMPALRHRFTQVLKEIEQNDTTVHDFLVMCCYVHMCRTPVSYDVAYAFLKADLSGYQEVYKYVKRLRSMIVDYSGAVVDDNQDHFVPRSTIVSEAIFSSVNAASFKRALLRFHKEVSPYRIARFDSFRRRGYDEKFATKAFTDWTEGISFYELLCSRDNSPHLRQQAALYLAKKKRFHEAFQWIDLAIDISGGRVPSIRNTHAIILFRANIGSPELNSPKVAETLKQSMDILAECHKYDQRKGYHALTFSEQALEYWDVYGNEAAKNYLLTARKWLREEASQTPWHRRIHNLLKQVESKLT